MKDLIIVGGSAAGVTAGIYAVRAGLSVTLITENFGGQLLLTEKVENYTGFKSIPSFDLAMKFREHLHSYKEIEVIEGYKVLKVEKEKDFFKVKTSKKEFQSKAVIIATGKRPRKLEVKGAKELEHKGIHYCAVCDGPLYKDKEVAVIGGGYSGIEEALYLSNICSKVYILEYGKELGGEEITKKQLMQKKNIEILSEVEVKEILGEKTVKGLKFKERNSAKEKEIPVSAIFVNIGELPNSDFVEAEKTSFNEIIINDKNETNISGLFAAGDVTNISVHQLIVAAGEGCKTAIHVNEYLRRK
ncbi:MAG: alkyl hydroperoxide reductase [Candidatus Diapherotrites archaeon CG10_big_fil_rev_8_21_14_0_10_31_34]|nr:MAG: alkyl hydroperoxide reductase [Candidatus Diapherotrites archaeon CG10_big_fil_rev_8_21_14_0_10_31_34]